MILVLYWSTHLPSEHIPYSVMEPKCRSDYSVQTERIWCCSGPRLEYRLSFWTIARVGIGNIMWHWFLSVQLSEYDVGIKLEHWLFFSTYVFILVHGTVCMRSCSLVLYVSLCHLPKRMRCWAYIGPLTFVLDTCLILSWNHSVTLIGQCILGGYDIGPVLEH